MARPHLTLLVALVVGSAATLVPAPAAADPDRRSAAVTALMRFYRDDTGLFDTTGWWNSANALTAVIDSGVTAHHHAIANTYDRNVHAYLGQFRNEYVDDTGWWALAWLEAYDVTGDRRYLETARVAAEHMHAYWDDVCGGGVWWHVDRSYKNAITNALYIHVHAALHNRLPGDTAHLPRALAGWRWYRASGMINAANLVNDGLDTATCRNNGQQVWTYNQGAILSALVELDRATDDPSLLTDAVRLANASTSDPGLNRNGILTEPCEPTSTCEVTSQSFKGVYARGLGHLNAVLVEHPYTPYLRRQADSAYQHDRDDLDRYGLRWAGPYEEATASTQQSAVDLMNTT